MGGFFEELVDEAGDFFEDYREMLLKRKRRPIENAVIGVSAVRPAFYFAERVDNVLKIIFGASILISGISATFLGFSSVSQMVEVLIFSWWGRVLLCVIGASYLMTATWRLAHVKRDV